MPAPSRWMIRCSLVYLLAGFSIGAALLISKAYPVAYPQLWQLLPIHIEVAIFGWIIQFTMGTAYWILPRYLESGGQGKQHPCQSHGGLVKCWYYDQYFLLFTVGASG